MLFLWGDKGILVCLELPTGKELWSQRIDGAFSGSPICIGDRLFCIAENGEVVVIKATDHFEELGRTPLGDDSHSTPAVANGHLYLRTFRHLMAIKARPNSEIAGEIGTCATIAAEGIIPDRIQYTNEQSVR